MLDKDPSPLRENRPGACRDYGDIVLNGLDAADHEMSCEGI